FNDDDLFITFGHLFKSEQHDQEYNAWVANAPNIPANFRYFEGINIKNKPQCVRLLFPILRGFNGINDVREVLPLFIAHLDLPNQKHTNALTSLFATAFNICLVFLDKAHIRGTDFKLPDDYRAAVTLGANLTKNRLVQVVFYIPPEIKVKILQKVHKDKDENIELADVLHWAITEIWVDIQRNIPLWAVQGRRFNHQKHFWDQFQKGNQNAASISPLQTVKFQEDETQTIEDFYKPGERQTKFCYADASNHKGASNIVKHCAQFGEVNFDSAVLQEKQEREFAPEIEQERQIKRPRFAKPATHRLDPVVVDFAKTGILPAGPFEAQNLLDTVRHNAKTILHLYAPRSKLGFESLKNLRLYPTPALPTEWSIPRHLILQLNLFAGQFYISSFADYTALCDILGLDWEGGGKDGLVVCANGFIDPALNPGKSLKHSFEHSPVGFLKVYLTKVRRDCESIEKTHMGKILNAVILRPEDF
ncbi:hypothetical protein OOU_Y34scaffold00486g1, partial [Pyricularia oryzae Y34]